MKRTKKRKATFTKKTIQKKEDKKLFAQEKFEKCVTPERGSLDLADEKF